MSDSGANGAEDGAKGGVWLSGELDGRRKRLASVRKPDTGVLVARGEKQQDGYCKVALVMEIGWGSVTSIGELIDAFLLYFEHRHEDGGDVMPEGGLWRE